MEIELFWQRYSCYICETLWRKIQFIKSWLL